MKLDIPDFQEALEIWALICNLRISECLQLNSVFYYYITLQAKQNTTVGQIGPAGFAISAVFAPRQSEQGTPAVRRLRLFLRSGVFCLGNNDYVHT